MPMKLYELEWGLYPRRVGIYLAEKGIAGIERIAFDALGSWPPPELERLGPLGTVPILETAEGGLIRSSLAILEFFEELNPVPIMLGATPADRAATREMLSVLDEAAIQFGIWCHKASALFAGRERQSSEAAAFAADAYFGRLRMLDLLIRESVGPFVTGSRVTIADCVAMATLQFAEHVYGVALLEDCDALRDWYASFAKRPSARLPAYPEPVLGLTRGLLQSCPPASL